ncbi:MAG: sugar transporter [Luteitalea sp.]|nr:sugar transporter [Luteitalea sp.]
MSIPDRPRVTALVSAVAALLLCSTVAAAGQSPTPQAGQPTQPQESPAPTEPAAGNGDEAPAADTTVAPPPDYVIGAEDVLGVVFWREKEMSGDVTVRPDGMITLPLLQDVQAEGLTPDQLRAQVQEAAGKYIQDPSVTVVVRKINSRRVFINGEVGRPGAYPLTTPLTVLQLVAIAGGLSEFADADDIKIMRQDGEIVEFNYKDVARGRNMEQNIRLRPGDTIIVP